MGVPLAAGGRGARASAWRAPAVIRSVPPAVMRGGLRGRRRAAAPAILLPGGAAIPSPVAAAVVGLGLPWLAAALAQGHALVAPRGLVGAPLVVAAGVVGVAVGGGPTAVVPAGWAAVVPFGGLKEGRGSGEMEVGMRGLVELDYGLCWVSKCI
jgi:hypothetical protein